MSPPQIHCTFLSSRCSQIQSCFVQVMDEVDGMSGGDRGGVQVTQRFILLPPPSWCGEGRYQVTLCLTGGFHSSSRRISAKPHGNWLAVSMHWRVNHPPSTLHSPRYTIHSPLSALHSSLSALHSPLSGPEIEQPFGTGRGRRHVGRGPRGCPGQSESSLLTV